MKNEKKLEEKQPKKEYMLKIKKHDGSIEEIGIPWLSEETWAKIPEEQKSIRYIDSNTSV